MKCWSATIRGAYQIFVVGVIATAGMLPLACSAHVRNASVFLLSAAVEDAGDNPVFEPELFTFEVSTLPERVEPLLSPEFHRRVDDDSVAAEIILAGTHLQRGPPPCCCC